MDLKPYARPGEGKAWLTALLASPPDVDDCILWPFGLRNGYGQCRGFDDRNVHIVVCKHFHGPRPKSMEACHSHPGNKHCCNPRHLRWDTHAANMDDMTLHGTRPRGESHGMAKLSDVQVEEIRRRYAAGGIRQIDLAREFGVTQSHVSHLIRHGRK